MLEDVPEHQKLMTVHHADLQKLGHQLIRLLYIHWLNDRLWNAPAALNSVTVCFIFQNHQNQNVLVFLKIIIITDHWCSSGSRARWTSWTSLGCSSLLHVAPHGTQSVSQLSDMTRRNNTKSTKWQISKDKMLKWLIFKKKKIKLQIARYSDWDIKGMTQWKTGSFTQDIVTQPRHCATGAMTLAWLLHCPKP